MRSITETILIGLREDGDELTWSDGTDFSMATFVDAAAGAGVSVRFDDDDQRLITVDEDMFAYCPRDCMRTKYDQYDGPAVLDWGTRDSGIQAPFACKLPMGVTGDAQVDESCSRLCRSPGITVALVVPLVLTLAVGWLVLRYFEDPMRKWLRYTEPNSTEGKKEPAPLSKQQPPSSGCTVVDDSDKQVDNCSKKKVEWPDTNTTPSARTASGRTAQASSPASSPRCAR